ncbi:dihydrofolate reductase [Congregibacter brevis]|uniref:Dihydrofolate reductase n=1 Tax=Congregibacter brevis TaxID=3081201 RepID=A0ABZ0IDF3_9GAMM|nr:dihydrofolate reductase [Congregibacter sp. IMCC45268]
MSDFPIALIVAAADNDVIGRDNALPWDLPGDLAHFKRTTMGKPILMGRLTYESIGRPLPGRTNIVISRDSSYVAEGVRCVGSLQEAIELANNIALIDGSDELMVIGGAQIYALALPSASRIYLTRVHLEPEGDAFLRGIDWSDWEEVARQELSAEGDVPAHTFLEYTRRMP